MFRVNNVYAVPLEAEWNLMLPEEREELESTFHTPLFPDLEISLDEIFHDLME